MTRPKGMVSSSRESTCPGACPARGCGLATRSATPWGCAQRTGPDSRRRGSRGPAQRGGAPSAGPRVGSSFGSSWARPGENFLGFSLGFAHIPGSAWFRRRRRRAESSTQRFEQNGRTISTACSRPGACSGVGGKTRSAVDGVGGDPNSEPPGDRIQPAATTKMATTTPSRMMD